MEIGNKICGEPFSPFSSITKEERKYILKVLRKEIPDTSICVIREHDALFTLGYYINCQPDKIPEITELINNLERP